MRRFSPRATAGPTFPTHGDAYRPACAIRVAGCESASFLPPSPAPPRSESARSRDAAVPVECAPAPAATPDTALHVRNAPHGATFARARIARTATQFSRAVGRPRRRSRLAGAAGSQASTCCSLIVSMNCGIAFIIVAASDVVHKWALSQEGLANPTAKPQAQQLKLEVCAWGRKRESHFRRSLLAGDCSKQRGQARIRARELHVKCRRGSKEDGEEG